jgi:Zn ribbon nucleic-acid-binding protein
MQCADPYCSHLQTKDRLVGKVSRCPICKTTDFILTRADLKLAKPRCVNCSQTKAAKEFKENRDKVKNVLQDFLNPTEDAMNPIVDLHEEDM